MPWDDIKKREAILRSGRYRVWSVTWKDVSDFAGQTRHGATTLLAACDPHQAKLVWTKLAKETGRTKSAEFENLNGMDQLVTFLLAPKAAAWGDACSALGVGHLALKQAFSRETIAALHVPVPGWPCTVQRA